MPGPDLDGRPVGGEGGDAPASAVLHDEVDGEGVLVHLGRSGAGGGDQGPLDLGAGGRATGVDDAGLGVAALPGQGQFTPGLPVEDGAEGDQLVDPAGPLVHQHPDRGRVAEVGAGLEGVGDVQVEGVGVLVEHGRHTPLGPTGGGLVEDPLGQQADPQPHGPRGAHGGGQARHSTPEDQQVQLGRHRRMTLRPARADRASRQTSKLKWSLSSSSPRVISSSTTTSPRTRTSRVAVVGESSQSV